MKKRPDPNHKDTAATDRSNGPIRMCAVCRKRLPKRELIRYVRTPMSDANGGKGITMIQDTNQTLPGRGTYHCGEAECVERFKKMRGFRKQAPRG